MAHFQGFTYLLVRIPPQDFFHKDFHRLYHAKIKGLDISPPPGWFTCQYADLICRRPLSPALEFQNSPKMGAWSVN
jgi:hypothetical protein